MKIPLCKARHHKYGWCVRPHHVPGGDHRGSDRPFAAGTYWPRIYPERLWKIRSGYLVVTGRYGQGISDRMWVIIDPEGTVKGWFTTHAEALACITGDDTPKIRLSTHLTIEGVRP